MINLKIIAVIIAELMIVIMSFLIAKDVTQLNDVYFLLTFITLIIYIAYLVFKGVGSHR